MTTVSEISSWSDNSLRDYVKDRIPQNEHFWATRNQLILMVARSMDSNGTLNSQDSNAINTPGFDRIFIIENGNYAKAYSHLGIDISLNTLSEISRI